MKLRYTPDARKAIRYRRRWWRAHRDKAPNLFADELEEVLNKLREDRDVARQCYAGERDDVAAVWRVLMPKTRHHVYYRRDAQAGTITVLLVDNAVGEAGPEF